MPSRKWTRAVPSRKGLCRNAKPCRQSLSPSGPGTHPEERARSPRTAETKYRFISQEGEYEGVWGVPTAIFMPQGKLTLLPEENIPEEQPARVEAQSQQWKEQGTVGVVFQHALCQCRQKELPALSQ